MGNQVKLTLEETLERAKMIRNLNDIVRIGEPIEDNIVDALIELEDSFIEPEKYHLCACVRDFTFRYVSES
jgi:hypothetical protein